MQRTETTLEFDYVIVGAGSAGCVLANRLSADLRNRVCLVEAGPKDRNLLIHVPLGFTGLIGNGRVNWRSNTVPQQHAAGRSIYAARGKVLGGSSSINGMVYVRGHPLDFDDWAKAGNDGWSYRDVLPYFRRSEDNERWRDSPFHGSDGPLRVSDMRARNPTAESFVESARLLQIPDCPDFNGIAPDGVGFRQVTQRNGRRESTATAFLNAARSRANLMIITEALTDKLVMSNGRATGIRIRRAGDEQVILARREIILSGGAIGSPEILMRSGIGAAAHLADMGIDVLRDLPGVGSNLQDHCTASVQHLTASTVPYGISLSAFPRLVWSALDYLFRRRGLLSSNANEAGAYVRTEPGLERPDIQLSFMSGKRGGASWTGLPFGYGHGYGLTAVRLRPDSRGTVRLVDRAPETASAIDPRLLSEPSDIAALRQGVKLARHILETAAFERYHASEYLPGKDVQSDAEIEAYIRSTCATVFHQVGTCAMGRGRQAVVDHRLSVHGVDGLRVADASIMPSIVGGNTNAATIMIAEKAADLILGRSPPPSEDTVSYFPLRDEQAM